MPIETGQLPEALRLEVTGPNTLVFAPAAFLGERTVIYGGQMIAHAILAAATVVDDAKEIESLHMSYIRPGDATKPLRYLVEPLSNGRTFSTSTITAMQEGRVIARAQVLQSLDETDFMRHVYPPMPKADPPEQTAKAAPIGMMFPGATATMAREQVLPEDLLASHPATLDLWMRYPEALEPVASQAILAWGLTGVLGPLTFRHIEGISEEMAHKTLSGALLTSTVRFLDRFELCDSVLLAFESTWSGRGRMFGRADVFSRGGNLVATFAQDAMAKAFTDGKNHTSDKNWIL